VAAQYSEKGWCHMMNDKAYVTLVGRVLIGLIFLMSGINKIADPQGTQQYMAAMGITTATTFLYAGAVFVEVAGGLSLLLGVWAKWGATALILFMIPTTLIFHTNFGDQNQTIHFLKNLAMMGGLLYVAIYGSGRLSIDRGVSQTAQDVESDEPFLKKVAHQ
jgi:putative oxidoreductase